MDKTRCERESESEHTHKVYIYIYIRAPQHNKGSCWWLLKREEVRGDAARPFVWFYGVVKTLQRFSGMRIPRRSEGALSAASSAYAKRGTIYSRARAFLREMREILHTKS